MNPSREETLFTAALVKPPGERASFLDGACYGDPALRQRLEALLAAHDQPDPLPPSSAPAAKATMKLDLAEGEDETVGTKIGRYKVLEKVGEGGCGVVYVAEQTEPVRRRVALKLIKLGMDTKAVVARFEAERQALAMMDHPNIAKVLDAGTTETGRPYFVMELVRGIRITEYCDQNHLTTKERLELFIKVCQAIQHAHQKGIVHRDIKPSNIMVTLHDGIPVPKVVDFGIAKAIEGRLTDATVYTQLHQFIGTPAYMSPEQAEMSGLDIDTRSDIYSLGVLLYELLAGSTPFDAHELMSQGIDAMRKTIREKEPERPSTRLATLEGEELTTTAKRRSAESSKLMHQLRGDLDWIVMKCLEKDRTRRYETANGLAADLKRHLENEPVIARPPTAAYRFLKAYRRNKLIFTATAAVLVALALGVAFSTWQAMRASSEAKRARAAEALAQQRLTDAEAITKFLSGVFQSPDPARDGRTITVAETLDTAAKKLETDLATQPERRAQLQATLGSTYFALGLYQQAIPLQEKALEYYRATFGSEHAKTLEAMSNLATSYYGVGRWDEAIRLQEKALVLYRNTLGAEHPDTLVAMNNLALSYSDAGRRDEALKLQEEVLALSRKVRGPEQPGTLMVMYNLALSYSDAGRWDEALKLGEEVLSLRLKVLGPEHYDTLRTIDCLGEWYNLSGHSEKALKLLEPGLPIFRKALGPEHWYTINTMRILANSYSGVGRKEDALKLREETLALSRRVLGPEHLDTIKAMNNLALSYADAGRWDEAVKLREDVLTLSRKVLGPEHRQTLEAILSLCDSYNHTGHSEKALKLLEPSLPTFRKVLGPEHWYTINTMRILANSYSGVGRKEDALKLREETLALSRRVLGPENPQTLADMLNLASSYGDVGRREEALKLQEEVLPLMRKVTGPESPFTIAAMNNLGDSYDSVGRREEALKMREELVPLMRKVNGPKHPDTLMEIGSLADSYIEAGRYQEALALLIKAVELDPKSGAASLTLATFQAWLGQDADYEATRRRFIEQAEGTDQAEMADCAAKAYCIRPSTNGELLTEVLNIAQRGVELAKGSDVLPWNQLALGLAEYRNGQYDAAQQTMMLAEQTAGEIHEIPVIADMYRVMSMFRQGKQDEARKLFNDAEAKMPPLPKDPSRPFLEVKSVSSPHDVLIGWMAYKEARALLNEPNRAKP